MEDIGIFTLGYRVFATFMTEFFLIMLKHMANHCIMP